MFKYFIIVDHRLPKLCNIELFVLYENYVVNKQINEKRLITYLIFSGIFQISGNILEKIKLVGFTTSIRYRNRLNKNKTIFKKNYNCTIEKKYYYYKAPSCLFYIALKYSHFNFK